MNDAFPDALVQAYESLIPTLTLPDKDDRHVVAAAIKAEASVIITSNLRDFPTEKLVQYKLAAQHPDIFIVNLLKHNPLAGLQAFANQVAMLKNPPKMATEVLGTLAKVGLPKTVEQLELLRGL